MNAAPIPEAMPSGFLERQRAVIADIGEAPTACFMTGSREDLQNWYCDSDLLNYSQMRRWLFEKYDGVRGFWNPLKRAFFSRSGSVLSLPERITAAMPVDIFLDGELW